MKYKVTGVVRVKSQKPGERYEKVPVRATVTADDYRKAFEEVRAQYAGRLADSDLTAEEL